MIGAGAKILGNIEVGKGAKIGAGSVVLAGGAAAYHLPWVPGSCIVGAAGELIRRRWMWTNTSTVPTTVSSIAATAFETPFAYHSGGALNPCVFRGGGSALFRNWVISVTMSSIAALTSSAVTGVLSLLTVLP